jgi:beta-1,4-mannosyltransferase
VSRVLSYPPRHPYVDRLAGTVATLVHRDEPWPRLPSFYDPAWVAAHTDDWDLAHLHFTWEQYPVERLAAVLGAHRDAGRPIVWTAHDLRNPHTPDPEDDHAYLEVLAEHASAVLTLTATAAAQVHDRFGRQATVVPHGPLLDAAHARRLRAAARQDERVTVLLHAKSLRRNLDVAGSVAAAARLGPEVPIRLLLSLHDEADVRRALADPLPANVTVWWHPPLDHDTLAEAIASAGALLLPYRWGTHSGLLELAMDVGTPVITTDAGAFADQGPVRSVPVVDGALDVDVLASALRDATTGALPPPPSWEQREAAAASFLAVHRRVYREVTGAATA